MTEKTITDIAAPVWKRELIQAYNIAGPRYTSYPTAPQLDSNFDQSRLLAAIQRSNQRGSPLSLYFHLPFCDTVCYFCACNKIVTANKQRAQPYLNRLDTEMAIWARHIDLDRPVAQLHWGGGTPTFLSDNEKRQLMARTGNHFQLLDDDSGDYSIEVHPGRMQTATISTLRQLGFNRLSMGVQDFNHAVQRAVNRFNSTQQVTELVNAARRERFHSIGVDIIYGLPLQTPDSLMATMQQVIDLSPDRLSLFNYAHMPERFKTQRQIAPEALPDAQQKLAMLEQSIEQLVAAGYIYVGMDHFAKPEDSLVKAQKQGTLQRNFQGYSTHGTAKHGDWDLIAFGVSAISAIDGVLAQNHKHIEDYSRAIDQHTEDRNGFATARGLSITGEDRLRGTIIMSLICHFKIDIQAIETQFQICFADYFATELNALSAMIKDHLVIVEPQKIEVLAAGRLLIRAICMVFDQYLDRGKSFSKVI